MVWSRLWQTVAQQNKQQQNKPAGVSQEVVCSQKGAAVSVAVVPASQPPAAGTDVPHTGAGLAVKGGGARLQHQSAHQQQCDEMSLQQQWQHQQQLCDTAGQQVSSTAAAWNTQQQLRQHLLGGAAVSAVVCFTRALFRGPVWMGLGKGACPLAFNLW